MTEAEQLIADLQRWVRSGGEWRLAGDDGDRLTVVLCTCDGGEEMGRLSSADDAWRAYVASSAPGSD